MVFPDYEIKTYTSDLKDQVEEFRKQSIREGNQSLISDKFDPEGFMGQVWLIFIDDKLASLSAVEASHYTGDARIAARVVRLHTLKAYRPTVFGMIFLPHQIKWCREQNFKIMWWSIDIDKIGLNAVYQKKRFTLYEVHKEAYDGWWQDLVFAKNMLFEVDPRSDLLQYVYYFRLEDDYKWRPKTNMFYYHHNGDTKLIKRMRPFLSQTPTDLLT